MWLLTAKYLIIAPFSLQFSLVPLQSQSCYDLTFDGFSVDPFMDWYYYYRYRWQFQESWRPHNLELYQAVLQSLREVRHYSYSPPVSIMPFIPLIFDLLFDICTQLLIFPKLPSFRLYQKSRDNNELIVEVHPVAILAMISMRLFWNLQSLVRMEYTTSS